MIQQEEIKTKTSTRIIIALIAVAMLISTAALYFGVIVGYGSEEMTADDENEYQVLMAEYQSQLDTQTAELSSLYYSDFVAQKSQIKAYNAASVTEISTRDLKVGSGRELGENDTDYAAYYAGFCSDESIFDSSFDDPTNPSSLIAPLGGTTSLIEGWLRGIVGMKIGGIREVSIPGEYAYKDTKEICGGLNSPLKFIIMAVDRPEEIPVSDRLWELYQKKYPEDAAY